MPEYKTYLQSGPYTTSTPLPQWYHQRSGDTTGYDLLCRLFEWDPAKRITARECLAHPWFAEEGGVAAK
jgi:cyclin-dependent kinase 8/11